GRHHPLAPRAPRPLRKPPTLETLGNVTLGARGDAGGAYRHAGGRWAHAKHSSRSRLALSGAAAERRRQAAPRRRFASEALRKSDPLWLGTKVNAANKSRGARGGYVGAAHP